MTQAKQEEQKHDKTPCIYGQWLKGDWSSGLRHKPWLFLTAIIVCYCSSLLFYVYCSSCRARFWKNYLLFVSNFAWTFNSYKNILNTLNAIPLKPFCTSPVPTSLSHLHQFYCAPPLHIIMTWLHSQRFVFKIYTHIWACPRTTTSYAFYQCHGEGQQSTTDIRPPSVFCIGSINFSDIAGMLMGEKII
jgi:hypothetical protein